MEEKFWETDTKVVDLEETIHSSPSSRLFANVFVAPLFFFAAVVIPMLWLTSGDSKMIVAGILFGGLPFAMVLLAIYGANVSLQTDYALRINSVSGTIEEIYTRKDKVQRTVYPIKEVLRISLSDPFDAEGGAHIVIRGMNILGVKWSVDLSQFAWERYKQGERSSDRRRIASIKTAEHFAEMLDVEIGSRLILFNVSRELRREFGTEWVHKWSDRSAITEQNRRLLDEENKQRQKVH